LKNFTDDSASIRPSRLSDARYIADNMREQDVKEVLALGNKPYEALVYSILHDEAQTFTLFYGKEPVLIFGTVKESHGLARIWMLATDKAYTKPRRIAILSKIWIKVLQKPYEILYNYVWIGNQKAVKLLIYLGCDIDKEIVTKKNLDFVKFSRCKSK